MSACAFPGCGNGADPRWGGYCDGHGAATERELENRHSAIVAIATEAVELRVQVAALREQRRVLREALAGAMRCWREEFASGDGIHEDHASSWSAASAALDATKEEP